MQSILLVVFFVCAQFAWTQPFLSFQSIEKLETEKKVDQLFLLIQKRLAVMHEVARTKWNQNLPIEDKVREEQILKELVDQSQSIQADEKWTAQFFQAQMDAAKEIQKNDFAYWKNQGVQKFDSTIPLAELRGYIDRINREIITLLSQIPDIAQNEFILSKPISTRRWDGFKKEVWDIAISPWNLQQ